MSSETHTLRAGFYMVMSTACFVVSDTCIKLLGGSLPLGQVICLIGVFSTLFLLVICHFQGLLKDAGLMLRPRVLQRSALDLMGTFLFVTALMHMPIANLATVMQTIPLVVVVIAMIFLGERAGISRIAAVIVGFIGVLLIVKPSPQSVSIYEFLALATVFVVALREIVTKRIGPDVPLLIIALANAIAISAGGLAFYVVDPFRMLTLWHLTLLVGTGFLVTCGYIFILATIRQGELSATAPFRYAEVVFAVISGILVFNEHPDALAYIGMALVVAAGLYAAHQEAAMNRDPKSELLPPAF